MAVLKRDFLPEDLEYELERSKTEGTVVVQARQSLEETRWLLELADQNHFIKGVVGWLDLSSPDLARQLAEYASHPLLVGLRHVIHDEADDRFMLRPDFMRGIGQLEEYGLTYDLLLFPKHLIHAVKLAEHFPGQRFVLDHLGKPGIKAGKMEPWKRDISRLAACPNVWCKLSGMVTEADHENWTPGDLKPYMEVVLDAFEPERIMTGSDWPVCRLAGEYPEIMNIVSVFTADMSEENRAKILRQNAVNFYQLKTED